jgi:ribonuclease D
MLHAMNNINDYLFIDTTHALENLCSRLHGSTWLAVDTEFMREKTYFPRLCLLQLATPQLAACIDTLTIKDIQPLIDLIYDTKIIKVMHAARQDLEIFYHLRGVLPQPVFDTQVAAPLLGYPEQMGYAALTEALLGVHLHKAHTRTDWTHRPLSDAQLHYAADDVRYLAEFYPLLRGKLEDLDRLAWLADDFAALTNPGQYNRAPEDAWLRVKGVQQVRGRRLATLQALAAWRERTARSEDRPRNWLLRDENLLDLAKIQPADRAALSHIRGLNEKILDKHGETLLKIIEESKTREPIPMAAAQSVPPPTAGREALVDMLLTAARLLGDQHAVNPAVITNRKELERLIQGDSAVNVLQGWRRRLAGESLLAILRGELGLRVVDDQVRLLKTD